MTPLAADRPVATVHFPQCNVSGSPWRIPIESRSPTAASGNARAVATRWTPIGHVSLLDNNVCATLYYRRARDGSHLPWLGGPCIVIVCS